MSRSRADDRQHEVATAHFASVWRFLRTLGVPSHAVDDAAQEVFVVVARKLEKIRPGCEKSFLFSTAVHVARQLRRKHRLEVLAVDPDDESLDPVLHDTPEDSLGKKEQQDLLLVLLDGLTEELRTAFVLSEIEGQSVPEIAAVLGIPLGTATSRVRRGRDKFEERLKRMQTRMRGGR
ncbi:RNA polymerase sigma factor RpoE [Labilithrix luteola]|uniref:RNA polymerase sigma factor RpoE n=1 Tax=Labilithrix luteola TaxID=1391654 RepID=A0A0K1Q044_9BACT|nr:RNA polymerase sigma factor [Labilithrix luteola]AKU98759.1 RNA polymerase sigma factor RpoE [Labilithrix luteola]